MTLRGVALTVMLFGAGFWIGPAVAACVGSPYQRIEQLDLDISRRPATALREIDSALGDLPARPFDYRYYTWLRLLRIIAAPDGHQDPKSLQAIRREASQRLSANDPLLLQLAIVSAGENSDTGPMLVAARSLEARGHLGSADSPAEICALTAIGDLFYRSDHPEMALAPLIEAYKQSNSIRMSAMRAGAASVLSMVMRRQFDLEGALQFGNEAISWSMANGLDDQAGNDLLNRGWIYYTAKRMKEALADFRRSDHYYMLAGDETDVGYADEAACQADTELHDVTSARRDCGSAVDILQKVHDPLLRQARTYQARLLVEDGKPTEALKILAEVLGSPTNKDDTMFRPPAAFDARARAYAALGDYRRGFEDLDRAREAWDVIHAQDRAREQATLRARFMSDQQRERNRQLVSELGLVDKLHRVQAREVSAWVAAGGASILLLILLAGVIAWNRSMYRRLARLDGLTGLTNRSATERRGRSMLRNAIRTQKPISIAIVDLDHFKSVNDTYGHAIGDEVLRAFATIIRKCIRPSDVAGRWGGEEFLLIIGNADANRAFLAIERLRELANVTEISSVPGFRIHFSAGISEWNETGREFSEVLASADRALYTAKNSGRSRSCLAITS